MLLNCESSQSKDAVHPLPRQCRREQHRSPVEEVELGAQLLFHGGHRVAVFLDGIPFVHNHHTGPAIFLNPARQALILLGDAIQRINHQNTDITAFNRLETAVDPEELRAIVDTAATTDSCRVHQTPRPVFPHDAGVNRVAGRAANRTDNGALFTANRIEQAGFPHIGPADDGHLDGFFLITLLILGREELERLVQHLGRASTVDGRHRIGLAETKAPEFSRHGQTLLGRLALVDSEQNRTGLAAQKFSDGLVGSRQPLLPIHNHQGNAGFLESQSRLLSDFRQKLTVIVEHQPTGVHNLELAISPVTVLIRAVTGHPWLIVNDGFSAAAKAIHQRGLANVGAPDDRDDGTRQVGLKRGLT